MAKRRVWRGVRLPVLRLFEEDQIQKELVLHLRGISTAKRKSEFLRRLLLTGFALERAGVAAAQPPSSLDRGAVPGDDAKSKARTSKPGVTGSKRPTAVVEEVRSVPREAGQAKPPVREEAALKAPATKRLRGLLGRPGTEA